MAWLLVGVGPWLWIDLGVSIVVLELWLPWLALRTCGLIT